MRITVMRGGLTGGVATVTGGRLTTSGGRTTGTIPTMSPMMREPLLGGELGSPPTTQLGQLGPGAYASGASTIMAATIGTRAATGSTRAWVAGANAPWCGTGSTLGVGAAGAGGAPGATSPVTKNARPRVCGDTSGANIKQPISTACPVNPMALVHTLLEDGS